MVVEAVQMQQFVPCMFNAEDVAAIQGGRQQMKPIEDYISIMNNPETQRKMQNNEDFR